MSYLIPDWLIGPGITTIQVTPQEFGGGILVTPVGEDAVDFFTVVDRIYYTHQVNLLEVAPTRSRQQNFVILSTGGRFTITELLRETAGPFGGSQAFNSLAALFHAWDYFLLTFTRAAKTYNFVAVNGGYDEEVARRRAYGVAHFAPAGVVETGVSISQTRNPSYQ